jgi:hypothetical protein
MDCGGKVLPLACMRRQAMQDDDTNALIGQMFALLTARFEDGAGLSIEGQAPDLAKLTALIKEVSAIASDAVTLIDAVHVVHACRS